MSPFKKNKKILDMKGALSVLQTQYNSLDSVKRFRNVAQKGDITCPLFCARGSLTVEAALILPLFLLASLTMLSFIDVMRFDIERQMQHQEFLRTSAAAAGTSFVKIAGREGDYIKFDDVYPIKLPIGGFGLKNVLVRRRSFIHVFNGYDDRSGDRVGQQQEYVYVTKYGDVYHKKRSCPSICISIKEVSGKQVRNYRNKDRKIYRKCSICAKDYTQSEIRQRNVYISDYGDRYHVLCRCSELTRTVRVVKIQDAEGRPPCKMCG